MSVVRTTIYIPSDLSYQIKMEALKRNERMNTIIVERLSGTAHRSRKSRVKKKTSSVFGMYRFGSETPYTHREEIYNYEAKDPT